MGVSLLRCAFVGSPFVIWSMAASAFPVMIPAVEIPSFIGHPRDQMTVISFGADKTWKQSSLQFDEQEEGGFLVVRSPSKALPERKKYEHARDKDPFNGALSDSHRVVLDDAGFGACDKKCEEGYAAAAKSACGGSPSSATRIDLSYRKTSAFLLACNAKPEAASASASAPKVELSTRNIKAEKYQLTYSQKSPILFEKLLLGQNALELFTGSLVVSLKPGSMLSFKYGEDDLPSVLTSYDARALGLVLELASSKRIMGVRVSSQVCCDMSLFKDAFYFPVIIEPPFNVSSLRKGSEIRYNVKHKSTGDLKIVTDLPEEKSGQGKEPGKSAGYFVLENGDAALGLSIRSKSENKAGVFVTGMENGKSANGQTGFLIDLAAQQFKKPIHYEIWFYMGDRASRDLVKEYAQNGIVYQLRPLP